MKALLIIIATFLSIVTGFAQSPIELKDWRFQAGDNPEFARTDYNDAAWVPLKAGTFWQQQGYRDYLGYAWFRVRFNLPSAIKNAKSAEVIRLALGAIADCDQAFLNGQPLGQNAVAVPAGSSSFSADMSGLPTLWTVARNYVVPANDPRLIWDGENVLAIRVYAIGGGGGLMSSNITVGPGNLSDYLVLDYHSQLPEARPDGKVIKTLTLQNLIPAMPVSGIISAEVSDVLTNKQVARQTWKVDGITGLQTFKLSFNGKLDKRLKATYRFQPENGDEGIVYHEDYPYFLTPQPSEAPRINGAKVVGMRPGSPFLHRVAVTGKAPLSIMVSGLPEGLVFDASSRVISGVVTTAGTYTVKVQAENSSGRVSGELKIEVGDRIALTPPMGWNSWNCFELTVDEAKVKTVADHFIRSGLADHGWTYINIDDGWEAPQRASDGSIRPNEKFGDMKALTDYIHRYGLKAGIYSSPGPKTCGNYLGSYQHEEQDAQTYADWGFDYLKHDWCSYSNIVKDQSLPELLKPYKIMYDALRKTDRDMVYSLCQYGMGNVWEWGDEVGGNAWRITGDIEDSWESVVKIGFNQQSGAPFAKPGNWNDPDMLIVGQVGWGVLHPTKLTPSEQYSHISLWCMLAAPLILGCDLTKLDDFTLNLLTNDEVIAIDQDPLGKQGIAVIKDSKQQVIVKDLEDGSKAVGLFNLSENDLKIAAPWEKLGITGKQKVRDVWLQKNLGAFDGKFESMVPAHGVVLVKISKK